MRYRLALVLLVVVATALLRPMAPSRAVAQTATETRYESSLLRLSEILGAVHFLGALCDSDDDPDLWRNQMLALLEAEEAFPQRRRLMTIRFNRGYHTLRNVYRSCTASANEALARYRAEGSEITRELVALYQQ